MHKVYSLLLLGLFAVVACSPEDETGPVDVRWDKESCARCVMAVSDRNFSAQVRGGPADSRTTVYKFDDIGCAVIWLEEQPWKDDPRTEVWVNDHRNGEWIDARQASYVTGMVTPMGYGLGAQSEPAEGALDFAEAVRHIYLVEETTHKHRGGYMQYQGMDHQMMDHENMDHKNMDHKNMDHKNMDHESMEHQDSQQQEGQS